MHMYLDFHVHFDVFDSESIRVFVELREKSDRTVISAAKSEMRSMFFGSNKEMVRRIRECPAGCKID